jgi:hypothetical protein
MPPTCVEKIQREIIERYDNISNLYVAYMNCGKHSDEFGREFFHAVGEILQGTPVRSLTLYHLDAPTVAGIVNHAVSKGGVTGRRKTQPTPRRYRKPNVTKLKKRRGIQWPARKA